MPSVCTIVVWLLLVPLVDADRASKCNDVDCSAKHLIPDGIVSAVHKPGHALIEVGTNTAGNKDRLFKVVLPTLVVVFSASLIICFLTCVAKLEQTEPEDCHSVDREVAHPLLAKHAKPIEMEKGSHFFMA